MSVNWFPRHLKKNADVDSSATNNEGGAQPRIRSRSSKNTGISYSEELRRVRMEIAQDMKVSCPEYAEFIRSIRRFTSSRLSVTPNRLLGVVSAVGGEGRTTIALAVAAALSEIHNSVLFVEADKNGSLTLGDQMGQNPGFGLSDWLAAETPPGEGLYETSRPHLLFLPYGRHAEGPASLATVARMRQLFSGLRNQFDAIVVDMPPLLSEEASPALLKELDDVLIVVSSNETRIADVEEVVRLCDEIPISGLFLNKLGYSSPGWLASLLGFKGRRGIS